MTKRLHRSSSSSSSEISRIEDDDDDDIDIFSSLIRLACRTKISNRYQSDIYTGLISSTRTYSNGKPLTRLEQLITLKHDDQIRSLLLILRHYALKHQWEAVLVYLKSLLQSSFCRAYLRLYWQLIFRYLLENFHRNHQIDLGFLSQIFENLFHSPTINRTQAFYSYLCLYLINPSTIPLYQDIEARYKNLPPPFSSGRCKHVDYIEKFDPKFEQLVLIYLHFLYDCRQWMNDYALRPMEINPFVKPTKISLEDERNLELWTFKLTTNFHEIQYLSNQFFDHYDIYLLKYLYFLYITDTMIEQIPGILQMYIEQHPLYLNAYKYSYWFDMNLSSLKRLIELDPSCSPYVLIYCRQIDDYVEIFDRLFDYLDYQKNRHDEQAWSLLLKNLLQFDFNDQRIIQCIRENWKIRKSIWMKFHFRSWENHQPFDQMIIAYIFIDNPSIRNKLRREWLLLIDEKDWRIEQADRLHRILTSSDSNDQ